MMGCNYFLCIIYTIIFDKFVVFFLLFWYIGYKSVFKNILFRLWNINFVSQ